MFTRSTIRILAPVALVLLLFVLFAPTAHAQAAASSVGFGKGLFLDLLELIDDGLTTLQTLITGSFSWLANTMQQVVGLKASTGSAVVYVAWKVLRDFCNMLFIVVLILMAFGTIFQDVGPKFLSAYALSKSTITGFLIAAITINFSLAVGQATIALGNQASNIMLGMMPKDIGGRLTIGLQVINIISTAQQKPVAPVPNPDTPLDKLDDVQKQQVKRWYGTATGKAGALEKGASTAGLQSLQNCLKAGKVGTNNCFLVAVNDAAAVRTAGEQSFDFSSIRLIKDNVDFYTNLLFNGQIGLTTTPGPRRFNDVGSAIGVIASQLESIFLLLVMTLSLLVVFIFMLVRIPFLWVLLIISPMAWLTFAFPNTESFSKWWKQMWAWNIFSPMYLFIIYFGLFMLAKKDLLTLSLADTNGNLPFAAQMQTLMFTIVIGFIFVGGAAWVLKLSQSAGGAVGSVLGGITGALGVTGEAGAVGAVYRGIGLESRVTGIQQGVAARYERVVGAPLRRREEEATARYKARFGGGPEREKFAQDQITKQRDAMDKEFQTRLTAAKNELDQAKTESARKKAQDKIKQLEDQSARQLSNTLSSRTASRESRIAAGELLMSRGKASASELQALGEQYRSISPVAQRAFLDRRNDQLIKDAKSRKYVDKDGKPDAAQMQSFMNLMGDPKKAKEFIESAETGKNKVLAYDAATRLKLMKDRNGADMTMEQVLEEKAETLNENDLLDVDNMYKDQGGPPAALNDVYNKRLASVRGSSRMLRESADADQRERMMVRIQDVATREQHRVQEREGATVAREYERGVERTQTEATKEQGRREQVAAREQQRQEGRGETMAQDVEREVGTAQEQAEAEDVRRSQGNQPINPS